jgi:hypothetical protein
MKKEKEIGITVTLVGKKRTLKEIANEYKFLNKTKGFILVAKWQQEQDKNKFSEEEVLKAQQAILCNIKDALMNENYIIEYLNNLKINKI